MLPSNDSSDSGIIKANRVAQSKSLSAGFDYGDKENNESAGAAYHFSEEKSTTPIQKKTASASPPNYNVIASSPEQETDAIQLKEESHSQTASAAEDADTGSDDQINNTGIPDELKSGLEKLSGISLDDVKVHYNSAKPAQLQAHAYAQGTDIHLAAGQEKHLAHEAWHVVQQKQGRVKSTTQMKGKASVNDDAGLEREADVMGEKAMQLKQSDDLNGVEKAKSLTVNIDNQIAQLTKIEHESAMASYGDETGEVGRKMTAELDALEPIKGSAPDTDASSDLYAEVSKYNPGTFARGHLLNHDLGGFGVAQNLFPISSGANSRHSKYVEVPVKTALSAAADNKRAINSGWMTPDGDGVKVNYEVKVLGDPASSQFECSWETIDQNGDQVETIKGFENGHEVIASQLNPTTAANIGVQNDDAGGPPKSADALASWNHGRRVGSEDIASKSDSIKFSDLAKDDLDSQSVLKPETEVRNWGESSLASLAAAKEKRKRDEEEKERRERISERRRIKENRKQEKIQKALVKKYGPNAFISRKRYREMEMKIDPKFSPY